MVHFEKNTICLNMIVKNESHIIVNTLENLCSYINFSYWVISDTGSTDNTKELITNFFKEKNIPGELVEHEWVDFAYNRTKALECAFNKTDYLLVFDADDSIVGDFKLPEVFDCDRYTLKFGVGFSYTRPLLFTNRKKWRFKGVLHEFLENIDPINSSRTIEGNYHLISGRSGSRNKNPNKYIDDATILKNAFQKEINSDYPIACRYAFYCAQSYKDAGSNYENEAIEWYKKCLTLKMWEQEQYHSCLSIGNIYMNQKDYTNALKYWYKTIEFDGERIDGIVNAQNYLRNEGQHLLVNALYHRFKNYNKSLQNKLFLFQSLYNCQLEYNNMISAYYVNDKATGYECFKRIIFDTKTEYSYLKSAVINIKYYTNFLKDDTDKNILELFYAYDKQVYNLYKNITEGNIEEYIITFWNTLFERIKYLLVQYNSDIISSIKNHIDIKNNTKNNIQIMITFTTCKRLDLFKQTINSILNHWSDVNKIDYWFCVDDNSSEIDREEMSKLYPWINYYMKTTEEKGHRQSMNIIWNKLNVIKPLYWIHMEDDFLFYYKTNYIETAIDTLNIYGKSTNFNMKQVLFNRNYSEIIDHYNIKGHIKTSSDNIALHNYISNGEFNYINCHYWPYFSFRPSLIETKAILELGNFDSENQFFEMDYAKKWTNAGYKSGFFNRITNRHIGRLTRDRNKKETKNAYELNNEQQFSSSSNSKDSNTANIPIRIINLERRQDRKNKTIQQLKDAGFESSEYKFIVATDGSNLVPTPELKTLFNYNDFGSRKGVIGCALSHYSLWKELLSSNDSYYVIMEDDFVLCPNFKERYQNILESGIFSTKDTIFLGYSMFDNDRKNNFHIYNNLSTQEHKIVPLNKQLYIGGYFMYSINRNGARKMVEYINKNGIKHGIDYLNKIIPNLENYECQPQLVFSEWNENGKKIDSDIQNNYDKIDFSTIKDEELINISNYTKHFVFIPNLDIIGNDIYYHRKSIEELLNIAYKDPKCIAVNTLGFFKNKLEKDKLSSSQYFKEGDGIYIKKEYYEANNNKNKTVKIKMLCNWTSSEQLCKEWSNMCESRIEYKWKNYELVWSDIKEEIDYYVIINSPPKDAYYEPKRTIVFQMEPWVNDSRHNWGVKTWGKWSEPEPSTFLAVRGRKTNCHNNAFWQLELSLSDFENKALFEKNKGNTISSICSSKYFDEGHIARIDFLKFLEMKDDIQLNLDIWNQDNKHQFKNYRGPLTPYVDKSKGLSGYKYYFMMENNYEQNFITEKLWEPILCETLVFYYGCPNVSDYIDSKAFVLLDINDFEKSYQIIKQAINEDWWSQRIDIIRKEKQKILNELAFFPVIDKIISQDIENVYRTDYEKYFPEFVSSNNDSNTNKSYCFIHSCNLKETGLKVLNKLLLKVLNKNTIENFDKIIIINIGLRIDENSIFNDKIKIINYSSDPLLYEIPTINLIHTFCQYNPKSKILYLHTKGILHKNPKCINDWIDMMVYFLVDKASECLKLLDKYDTVGCNYTKLETVPAHYSGNFWWANSNYIKLLEKIPDGSFRHAAEWWLLSTNNTVNNYYTIHNSGIDHYKEDYPIYRYK